MVEFEWTEDIEHGRTVWFVGTQRTTGQDRKHDREIMEQLNAELVGWA